MLSKLLVALVLMAACVTVHAFGIAMAFRLSKRRPALAHGRFWSTTRVLIQVAAGAVLLHLLEIALWAAFYAWKDGMPDFPTAIYFSAVTYTTTGYGDLVLPPEWRMVGAVEALTGILMCGWSTGFFFAVVSEILRAPAPPLGRDTAGTPAHA